MLSHLKCKHSNSSSQPFEDIYKQHVQQEQEGRTPHVYITKKEEIASKWINAVVEKNLPLSFVESECIRNLVSTKETIGARTLRKNITASVDQMRENIRSELPNVFAVVFDEWSHHASKFLAIFACYNFQEEVKEVLLGFCHLDEEPSFGAERIKKTLKEVLSIYSRSLENVCCIVGDNCNVNRCIAAGIKAPLLGCTNHKLALAVNDWFESKNDLMNSIQVVKRLMVELRTPKNKIRLSKHTSYSPIVLNATRWSSCYVMLQRFVQIEEHLKKIPEVQNYLPSLEERACIKESLKKITCFQQWTKMLQQDKLSWYDAQLLLEHIITEEPFFQSRLNRESSLTQNQAFEKALFKVCEGNETRLSRNEEMLLVKLEKDTACVLDSDRNIDVPKKKKRKEDLPAELSENDEYAYKVMMKFKEKRNAEENKSSKYIDLKFIPATSNSAERLFSNTKFIMSDVRTSTLHDRFEELILLKKNRSFWKMKTISESKTPREKDNSLLQYLVQKQA